MIEPLPVVRQRLDFLGACHEAAHQLAVHAARRFRQPVMHPQPFLAADHQSPFSEIRQMTGYRGLRQVQCLMQMADADLAAASRFSSRSRTGSANALNSSTDSSRGSGGLLLHPHSRIYTARIEDVNRALLTRWAVRTACALERLAANLAWLLSLR